MSNYHVWNGSCAINAPLYPGNKKVRIKVIRLDLASPEDAILKTTRDGSVELLNPHDLTNNAGKIQFYTRKGRYQVTANFGMFSQTWENISIGPQTREKINKTASWTLSEDDDFTLIETTGSENIVVTVPLDGVDGIRSTDFEVSGTHFGTGTLTFVGEVDGEDEVEIIIPEELSLEVPYGAPWTLMKSKFAGVNKWSLHGFLNLAG